MFKGLVLYSHALPVPYGIWLTPGKGPNKSTRRYVKPRQANVAPICTESTAE